MKVQLARLDAWLAAHRATYRSRLRPGAAPADLESVRARLAVPTLGEIGEMYAWHDGQEVRCTKSLWRNYEWIALSRVHGTLGAMEDLEDDDDLPPGWWKGWFPFLDNGSGDAICVDLTGSAGHGVGAVIDVQNDFSAQVELLAPSLRAWLEEFVSGLAEGTFREYED